MVYARLCFVVLVVFLFSAPAFAQTAPAREAGARPSWIELGGGLGLAFVEGGYGLPSAQARINLSSQAAVEVSADFLAYPGLSGWYQMRLRGILPIRTRVKPYFTAGGLGYFETVHYNESRYALATGDVVVNHAHRYNRLDKPFALTLGGGARIPLPLRMSVETGVEAWFSRYGAALAVRAMVMVPIGPRRPS